MRLALVTPSARILPELTAGMAVPAMGNAKSVSPRSSEAWISTDPLSGMCAAVKPDRAAKVAPARCAAVPMPPDA